MCKWRFLDSFKKSEASVIVGPHFSPTIASLRRGAILDGTYFFQASTVSPNIPLVSLTLWAFVGVTCPCYCFPDVVFIVQHLFLCGTLSVHVDLCSYYFLRFLLACSSFFPFLPFPLLLSFALSLLGHWFKPPLIVSETSPDSGLSRYSQALWDLNPTVPPTKVLAHVHHLWVVHF